MHHFQRLFSWRGWKRIGLLGATCSTWVSSWKQELTLPPAGWLSLSKSSRNGRFNQPNKFSNPMYIIWDTRPSSLTWTSLKKISWNSPHLDQFLRALRIFSCFQMYTKKINRTILLSITVALFSFRCVPLNLS